VIGAAVMVAKIATGETEERVQEKNAAAVTLAKLAEDAAAGRITITKKG
jgi:hypothetical protein